MNDGSRRFAGRNAVITGGARGIGLAIAERLASEGARVALWDVDGAAAKASAAALGAAHRADAVDVTDEKAVDAAADAVYGAFGRVDILVNNAGILGPVAPLWEQEPPAFRHVINVNLTGMYLVCRAIVPRMRKQAGPSRGKIVNVSSIQGKEGLAQSGAYGISKAGVIGLTKVLGKDLARRRHHGQLRDAGGGRNRHGEGDHARAPRRHRRAHSDGTFCRGARNRGHGRVSRIRRLHILDRRRVRRIRRPGHLLGRLNHGIGRQRRDHHLERHHARGARSVL